MRFAVLILAILLSAPVLAAGASSYHNARYGATADIPSGFVPAGTEEPNGDGMTFRNNKGSMVVIFGADVPGSDFEAYAESRYLHARDYDHYSNVSKTITPTWAELSASSGHQQMRMRIIPACNGRLAVAVKYTGPTLSDSVWSKLKNSLQAGPARAC